MPERLAVLAARLREARSLTVVTGAGVSAASGVPTFRGPDGLWKAYRPEDLATPEAFARSPRLVWEWYDWRRTLISRCRPNAAHEVLARWSRRPGFTMVTQNVDGLHELAGTLNLIRFHGSIWQLRCVDGCGEPAREDRTAPLPALPPKCAACGGLERPGVVWFGEPIPRDVLARADAATRCDVLLSVGTSSVVYPAAGLAQAAQARGAFVAEINPAATEASADLDLAIDMAAEVALPLLDERLGAERTT